MRRGLLAAQDGTTSAWALGARALLNLVLEAGGSAGLTRRHRLDRWRHTYAASLVRRGEDIQVAQPLIGPRTLRRPQGISTCRTPTFSLLSTGLCRPNAPAPAANTANSRSAPVTGGRPAGGAAADRLRRGSARSTRRVPARIWDKGKASYSGGTASMRRKRPFPTLLQCARAAACSRGRRSRTRRGPERGYRPRPPSRGRSDGARQHNGPPLVTSPAAVMTRPASLEPP